MKNITKDKVIQGSLAFNHLIETKLDEDSRKKINKFISIDQEGNSIIYSTYCYKPISKIVLPVSKNAE